MWNTLSEFHLPQGKEKHENEEWSVSLREGKTPTSRQNARSVTCLLKHWIRRAEQTSF